jgi:hypothetical protein
MICIKCLDDKNPDEFYAKFNKCKACISEIRKQHYRQNAELVKARVKEYQLINSEQIKSYKRNWNKSYLRSYRAANRKREREWNKKYRENNRELVNNRCKESRKKNRGVYNYHSASYKRKIKQCTPSWLNNELLEDIKRFYVISKNLSIESGIEHHVDHIDPIVGKLGSVHVSCGLNVPWNLQIITKTENLKKRSKVFN